MKNIIFDCERMKYPNTGIYYYCLNLGKQIRLLSDELKEQISYFGPAGIRTEMGGHQFINQHSLQKFLLPSLKKYSLWHSTYQNTAYLPERNRRIKVVLTIHDLNFMYDDSKSNQKKEKYLRHLQYNINRADAIVCISDFCRKDVETNCNTLYKPVYTILNGTNKLEEASLEPTSYKPEGKFLFTIGVLNRKKNLHSLLNLLQGDQSMELLIAGKEDDESYKRYLLQTARELGVENKLHLLGTVSETEKSWYFKHCYAFASASLAEGFCLPVAEAMSEGKPLFLSNKTALPEIGGKAAFYFSGFQPEDMQHTFQQGMQLYEDGSMQDAIRERAAGFSWEAAARQYLDVYRSLIG